jgi:glycosyltransferase involved in cell wall biosynthesis
MKILELSPYWVCPPNGGGPIRIYNLNKEISKEFEIVQVSFRARLTSERNYFKRKVLKINDNYYEYQYFNIPILLSSYFLYKLHLPYDMLQSSIINIFKYGKKFNGDIVQIEHPWLIDFAYKQFKEKPLIFTAHNVEYVLIKDLILKKAPHFKGILPKVKELEKRALEKSDIIFTVSAEDLKIFNKSFKIKKDKMRVIPNGVDCSKYEITPQNERDKFKKMLGLPLKKIALFIGSDHYPNREAISFIKKFADSNLDVVFLIVGGAGRNMNDTNNIIFTGYVDKLKHYIKASDIAINPLVSGSGTNLKMLEYLAAGLPTITTKIGNRGLDLRDKKEVIISDLDKFPESINQVITDKELYQKLCLNGREIVEKKYDWKVIAQEAMNCYREFL